MEGMTLVGSFALVLAGLYFAIFHGKDYMNRYNAEDAVDCTAGPEMFHVAVANAALVPLALAVLEEARAAHPAVQYVLTVGDEQALVHSIQEGSNDVVVVSSTVEWMAGVSVCDVTVKPPSVLLDEGDIALKPLDTSVQSQKILYRHEPSALVDEFVQALCARGL